MWYLFFLSQRPPPRSTRTDTLVPYTTLFRSTTGVPKGAMLSHGNLVANVLQLQAVARPALRDLEHGQLTIISALPLYHVFAMTVCGLFGIYARSEEHTSELKTLMRISYAVFCLKKQT